MEEEEDCVKEKKKRVKHGKKNQTEEQSHDVFFNFIQFLIYLLLKTNFKRKRKKL